MMHENGMTQEPNIQLDQSECNAHMYVLCVCVCECSAITLILFIHSFPVARIEDIISLSDDGEG